MIAHTSCILARRAPVSYMEERGERQPTPALVDGLAGGKDATLERLRVRAQELFLDRQYKQHIMRHGPEPPGGTSFGTSSPPGPVAWEASEQHLLYLSVLAYAAAAKDRRRRVDLFLKHGRLALCLFIRQTLPQPTPPQSRTHMPTCAHTCTHACGQVWENDGNEDVLIENLPQLPRESLVIDVRPGIILGKPAGDGTESDYCDCSKHSD